MCTGVGSYVISIPLFFCDHWRVFLFERGESPKFGTKTRRAMARTKQSARKCTGGPTPRITYQAPRNKIVYFNDKHIAWIDTRSATQDLEQYLMHCAPKNLKQSRTLKLKRTFVNGSTIYGRAVDSSGVCFDVCIELDKAACLVSRLTKSVECSCVESTWRDPCEHVCAVMMRFQMRPTEFPVRHSVPFQLKSDLTPQHIYDVLNDFTVKFPSSADHILKKLKKFKRKDTGGDASDDEDDLLTTNTSHLTDPNEDEEEEAEQEGDGE